MKRVLLKLSGEALAGEKKTGFDEDTVRGVAKQVKMIRETLGLQKDEPVIPFSAETKQGREEIFSAIHGILSGSVSA